MVKVGWVGAVAIGDQASGGIMRWARRIMRRSPSTAAISRPKPTAATAASIPPRPPVVDAASRRANRGPPAPAGTLPAEPGVPDDTPLEPSDPAGSPLEPRSAEPPPAPDVARPPTLVASFDRAGRAARSLDSLRSLDVALTPPISRENDPAP